MGCCCQRQNSDETEPLLKGQENGEPYKAGVR